MGVVFSTSIVLSYKLYMESKRDISNYEKYIDKEVKKVDIKSGLRGKFML